MEEKVYFMPGDVVTLKQSLENKPVMYVVKKETLTFRPTKLEEEDDKYFVGIKCRWFTTSNGLQEAVFNTKDLIKIKK